MPLLLIFIGSWCLVVAVMSSASMLYLATKGNVELKGHIACAGYYIAAAICFHS